MDINYTPEQQRLREELREYFADLMTEDDERPRRHHR